MTAKRLFCAEGGSSTVEFALVVPMLLVLLFGVMQLGMLLHANGGIRELMGWSGRAAIIAYQNSGAPPSDDAFTSLIRTEARSGGYGLDPAQLTPAVSVATNEESGVRSVTITLSYSLGLTIPLLPTQTVNLRQSRTYFAPI